MSTEQAPATSRLCDAVIAKHSLLHHPFYVAWSEGTLPVAALRDYAGEYGAFIDTIASGWDTVGSPEIARVEEKHSEVWDRTFRELPQGCGEYFDLHRDDYQEPSLLADELDNLRDIDRERAVGACERMCRGLYDALTGIHSPYITEGTRVA